MKKKSNENLLTFVVVIGILVLGLVYFFVFKKFNEKRDEIEASNLALETRVNELEQYYTNRTLYETKIAEKTEVINRIQSLYPADAREEDALMMAVELQTKDPATAYRQIEIGDNVELRTISAELAQGAYGDKYKSDVIYAQRGVAYAMDTQYDSLKDMIKVILENKNKVGLSSIVFEKVVVIEEVEEETDNEEAEEEEVVVEVPTEEELGDQSNFLTGTITLEYYNLRGTDKEYTLPPIKAYVGGTVDIFGQKFEEAPVQE